MKKDVYKRQPLFTVNAESEIASIYQCKTVINVFNRKAVAFIWSLTPVSYTHLDVYKRQGYQTACKGYAGRNQKISSEGMEVR